MEAGRNTALTCADRAVSIDCIWSDPFQFRERTTIDASDLRMADDQRRINLGRLMEAVLHDFGNVFNAASGFADLAEKCASAERRGRLEAAIRDAINRGSDTLSRFMPAILESRKWGWSSPAETLDQVLEMTRHHARRVGAVVRREGDDSPPAFFPVMAVRHATLCLVFRALDSIARVNRKGDGELVIHFRRHAQKAEMVFRDNGLSFEEASDKDPMIEAALQLSGATALLRTCGGKLNATADSSSGMALTVEVPCFDRPPKREE